MPISYRRDAYSFRASAWSSISVDSGLGRQIAHPCLVISPKLAIFLRLAHVAGTTMRSRLGVFGLWTNGTSFRIGAAIVERAVGGGDCGYE